MPWTSGDYFLDTGQKAEVILEWSDHLWPEPQCIVALPVQPMKARIDILSIGVFTNGNTQVPTPGGGFTWRQKAFYLVTVINNTNEPVTFHLIGGSPN
jgi:hypothetical protein